MSNDVPPRACLADFGLMTMVLDPSHPISGAQLEGETMIFMAPELLAPTKFGMKQRTPTSQTDIYAFGFVILQVCEEDHGNQLSTYIAQVLTGEIPSRSVSKGFFYSVVEGSRPDKPENASSIGFSDLLWGFVQRCWDGNKTRRPKVAEVITHLGEAATNWNGLMPPCVVVEDVPSDSEELSSDSSDSMMHREFEILTLPWCFPSSNGTGGIFECSESPIEAPQEEQDEPPDEVEDVLSDSEELSSDSSDSMMHREFEILTLPWCFPSSNGTGGIFECSESPIEAPQEEQDEPSDDPHVFRHLDQDFRPPPSMLPARKRKGFSYFKSKLRGLF